MTRLLVLFPHVSLGGGETATMDLAAELGRRFDLRVAALETAPPGPGPTLHRHLADRFGEPVLLRRRWQLRPLLAAHDAVLWYGVVPQVPRALGKLRARRPLSIRVVHTGRRRDGELFTRRWRGAVDATVCVDPAVARRIPGAVFVPNACSTERLRGPARELFAPSPRRTLGFLGRLLPFKNVEWLVDHVGELDCNLAVQGLDTAWLTAADLARRAARLGLAERVRFLPPGGDVGTLLRSVDALVIPSRREGLPMVALEAGRLGVPVIATRVGALPELFAHEILFVDTSDGVPAAASLRAAVERAAPSWGERLRARVEALCEPASVAARYAEVLGSAQARRAAARARVSCPGPADGRSPTP